MANEVNARRYDVQVEASATPEAKPNRSYVLLFSDKGSIPDASRLDALGGDWKQYERQVRSALAMAGFVEAETAEAAELAIVSGFSVVPRRSVTRRLVPPTGLSDPWRNWYVAGGPLSSLSDLPPPGYPQRVVRETETYYAGTLMLVAFDARRYIRKGEAEQLWATAARFYDESDDPGLFMPVLLAVAYEHFGTDSELHTATIKHRDKTLKYLLGKRDSP